VSIRGDRLEALWVCALSLGLRRGELLGLRWVDIDQTAQTVSVRQALLRVDGRLVLAKLKTDRSARTIPAPAVVLEHLREHRTRQLAERLRAGQRWRDSGLVFTSTIGTPLEPRNVDRAWHEARVRVDLRLGPLARPAARLRDLHAAHRRLSPNGHGDAWAQPDHPNHEYLRSRTPPS
jgi:integrase